MAKVLLVGGPSEGEFVDADPLEQVFSVSHEDYYLAYDIRDRHPRDLHKLKAAAVGVHHSVLSEFLRGELQMDPSLEVKLSEVAQWRWMP